MRARLASVLLVCLTVAPALAGCSDFFDVSPPDYHVRATELSETGWNHDHRFEVQVCANPACDAFDGNVSVTITADSAAGQHLESNGAGHATLELPDGTWDLTYRVGGHKWHSFSGARIDATPPTITGLETIATADAQHRYTLGAAAVVQGAVALRITDLQTGALVGTSLPVALTGLADGLQAYLVSARDEAGNYANATVQVQVGAAAELPAGKYTFGVVARYTNTVRLWDLTDLDAYMTRSQAASALGGHELSAGYDVTPTDPAVAAVVQEVVTDDMNTAEAALALYHYMADHLEYDETRLDNNNILTPHQVLLDTEDPGGADCSGSGSPSDPCDGIVRDGAGNGVRGGICRELAATYVSLLRAAGVPARLVSGYVGGSVDGFHAWAEFYGGSVAGQSPWLPVDVSPIDGPYKDAVMLQSFGIQLPDYLALRTVPEAGEKEGWSTAIGVRYQWPAGSNEPDIDFAKDVTATFTQQRVLCFDAPTRSRALADAPGGCGAQHPYYLDHFPAIATRVIDYGIDVRAAPSGTSVRAEVAYPFPESVLPNQVSYKFYGPAFTKDVDQGKAVAAFAT